MFFRDGLEVERESLGCPLWRSQMTKVQKITLSPSRDIPFNKLVLSQSNVRRVKTGVSIEQLAESIAQRTLLQSLNVRAVVDTEGNETGMFEVPAGGGAIERWNFWSSKSAWRKRKLFRASFTAQVTENVYDTPTGRVRLVPQGARLIGVYDSQVAFGQSRVLLVWTRLIMPNGRSIVLERQPGADTAGYAGLEDGVDNHWGALFKAALLSTLLGVGSELGAGSDVGNNGDIIRALRRGSSDSLNQAGHKVVQRNLNVQPTLTIRPGFPVRVIVNRDLVLEPCKG